MIPEEIEIVIIDDEEIWREGLAANLTDFGFKVVGKAATYHEAIDLLETISYDLILLDISLEGENSGIGLGNQITAKYKKPFIYITAEYQLQNMKDVIDSKPSAYIIKPVNPKSLVVAIQNAINNFSNQTPAKPETLHEQSQVPFFFVKFGSRYKKVEWENVVFLRHDQNHTRIFNAVDQMEYSVRSPLTKMIQYMIPAHLQHLFVQVNRGEAINLSYVTELNADEIKTPFNTFYVTESYNRELKKKVAFFT